MVAILVVLGACTGAPAVSPPSAASIAPGASTTPTPPPEGAPLPWPSAQLAPIPPGRHAISPPFDIAFTIEVPDGWHSLHLLGEFTDLAWFEGSTTDGVADRIIAFGHPATLRGEIDVTASGLTPADAAGLYRARADLETGPTHPIRIDGNAGFWLDVHAPSFDTRLYSGPGTNGLGIGPDKEVRVILVPVSGSDLLVVTVHADAHDLASTWRLALPILSSIDLEA